MNGGQWQVAINKTDLVRVRRQQLLVSFIVEAFAEWALEVAELDDHNGCILWSNTRKSIRRNIIANELRRLGRRRYLSNRCWLIRHIWLPLNRGTSPNDITGQYPNCESQHHQYRIKVGAFEGNRIF